MSETKQTRAQPDALVAALYPRQPQERLLSDTDIKAINGDMDAATALAQRDATIAELKTEMTAKDAALQQANEAKEAAEKALRAATGGSEDAPAPPGTPAEITLTAPHGFIDDAGRHRTWLPGTVVRTLSEIALLIGRGAPHEVTKPAAG